MKSFSILSGVSFVLLAVSGASAAVLGSGADLVCNNEVVNSEKFIGANQDVKLTFSHCEDAPVVTPHGKVASSLTKRQDNTNVCDAPCNTVCFNSPGGGPVEEDCKVIADALQYELENESVLFNVTAAGTATDKVTMHYKTCLTYFQNQDTSELSYCRNDWSKLVTWLASDCSASNNAHGGLCVAADQRWYVQVQGSGHE